MIFLDYQNYCIQSAPSGFWITEEFDGDIFVLKTVQSIEDAKKFIDDMVKINKGEK